MQPVLPIVNDFQDYRPFFRDADAWRQPMDVICDRHQLSGEHVRLFEGSSIVVYVGDRYVVKLAPPFWAEDLRREQIMLPHLADNLGVQTPELVEVGELAGWPYIVLTRVAGVSLESAWDHLARREKIRIAGRVGEMMTALHAAPIPEALAGDAASRWQKFVDSQRKDCALHHQERNGPNKWVSGIDAFLQKTSVVAESRDLAVLHADLTRENVFISGSGDSITLSGVIDFGDAMVGDPLYECGAPCLQIVAGDRDRMSAFVDAFDTLRQFDRVTLQHTLLAWFLLHQFSSLSALVEEVPAGQKADTLEDLMNVFLPV